MCLQSIQLLNKILGHCFIRLTKCASSAVCVHKRITTYRHVHDDYYGCMVSVRWLYSRVDSSCVVDRVAHVCTIMFI